MSDLSKWVPDGGAGTSPVESDCQPHDTSRLIAQNYNDTNSLDAITEVPRKHGIIYSCQTATRSCYESFCSWIVRALVVALLVAYTVYLAFCIRWNKEGATGIYVITGIVVFFSVYYQIKKRWGQNIYDKLIEPVEQWVSHNEHYLAWTLGPLIALGACLFLVLYVVREARQLQSLLGVLCFLLFLTFTSKHPGHIKWRTVFVGLGLQVALGVLLYRWPPGRAAVTFVTDWAREFVLRTNAGSSVVFGDPFFLFHAFAFLVLPTLIFWGGVLALLVYTGVLQFVTSRIGWFIRQLLGTSAIESIGALVNMIMNWCDAAVVMSAYIPNMTRSELHTFLVACHSTVGGYPFAIMLLLGAPAEHLVIASVMSVPGAIVVAKLNYPETERKSHRLQQQFKIEDRVDSNLVEAACSGAYNGGRIALVIMVIMIAILSLLDFVDSTLEWLGGNVGHPELSVQSICSAVFAPISYLIGIQVADCRKVGSLIGVKVFTSEVITYTRFRDDIFSHELTEHSMTICVYALCGASGLVTLVTALGVWKTLFPQEAPVAASQLLRLFINANICCLLTASVASFIYDSNDAKALDNESHSAPGQFIVDFLDLFPSYKDIGIS